MGMYLSVCLVFIPTQWFTTIVGPRLDMDPSGLLCVCVSVCLCVTGVVPILFPYGLTNYLSGWAENLPAPSRYAQGGSA